MLHSLKLLLSILILFLWGSQASVFASESSLPAGSVINDSVRDDDLLDGELDLLDLLDEEDDSEKYRIADPVKYWNMAMYHFNDKLYFWGLKPLTKGYIAVTSKRMRSGVENFFSNIATPIRLVGCILQLKIKNAGTETARFVINSTVGVLGFGDPAKKYYGLKPKDEDLGQTFGFYGIGNGFYIVWPVFGPSSIRDSVGMIGDMFLDPIFYVKPREVAIGIRSYKTVNNTSFRIGDYEAMKAAAIDPYEALKDAYIQNRIKKINE